jgi:hypothetical protein
MSQLAALYLRIDQKVRGPFSPELLTELAQSGVIAPATEASANAAGPWIPLQATEGCAELFPVRPALGFKSQTFENANPASAPPVDHFALIAAANRPASPQAKPGAQGTAGTPTANEVVEILRENARIQAQFEKPLDLTPRSNRRRGDYLILMIPVNGFFIWRLLASQGDPTIMVYSFSGIVLFSVGITWVMYGVMDRY